jgi:signal transduction histidine kinase
MKPYDAAIDNYAMDGHTTFQMNSVVRHRLRNLCAGMRMAVERFADQLDGEQVDAMVPLMISELDNLQVFTDRSDLLFDRLPPCEAQCIGQVVVDVRTAFREQFPAVDLDLDLFDTCGEQELEHGSWLSLALGELLRNAGEAAREGTVTVKWVQKPISKIIITNPGGPIPAEIPVDPPRPFFTCHSHHYGIGLAIVARLCRAIGAELDVQAHAADVSITIRSSSGEW